ncbi:hypothetical protein A7C99_6081 [Trichophyton rubrum]|uniref:Uncharacterized protein n=1 Tax=Trichophyton rubrum TaxID=5551 RepID=A0A178EUB1_TRIRU|nr:hypothetical protein A7C99_6081 [Trichophyton rubrum]
MQESIDGKVVTGETELTATGIPDQQPSGCFASVSPAFSSLSSSILMLARDEGKKKAQAEKGLNNTTMSMTKQPPFPPDLATTRRRRRRRRSKEEAKKAKKPYRRDTTGRAYSYLSL